MIACGRYHSLIVEEASLPSCLRITARDENGQIIAEKLGGGGHINSAGAQFDHTNMEEAISTLKETIDDMIEKGDI